MLEKNRDFIGNIFASVVGKYDVMNDVMSLGFHRVWKQKLIDIMQVMPGANCLDLSSGTGDIALLLMKKYGKILETITLVDPDANMLDLAKKKLLDSGISLKKMQFQTSTAEDLNFEGAFNVITLTFGARNFSNLKLGLENCYKSLKPGGCLYCMEFSPQLNNHILQKVYHKYLDLAVPKIGKYVANNEAAYRYLSDSIVNFLTPDAMLTLGKNCNFSYCDVVKFAFGGVCLYVFKK